MTKRNFLEQQLKYFLHKSNPEDCYETGPYALQKIVNKCTAKDSDLVNRFACPGYHRAYSANVMTHLTVGRFHYFLN